MVLTGSCTVLVIEGNPFLISTSEVILRPLCDQVLLVALVSRLVISSDVGLDLLVVAVTLNGALSGTSEDDSLVLLNLGEARLVRSWRVSVLFDVTKVLPEDDTDYAEESSLDDRENGGEGSIQVVCVSQAANFSVIIFFLVDREAGPYCVDIFITG